MPFNSKFTLDTRQKFEACGFGLLPRFCTGFVGVFSLIHANLLNLLGFLFNFDERYENSGKSTCTMTVQ